MNKVVAVLILSLIFTALGINMSAMTSAPQQVSVQITLKNIKYVNVSVLYLYSNNTVKMLASYILNKSSEIYVPVGSYLAFESSQPFVVVGPVGNVSAFSWNEKYEIVYNYPVNESSTFIIIANITTTTTNTTTTLSSSTIITITLHQNISNTLTLTSHTNNITIATSHNFSVKFYALIIIVVIIMIALYLMIRVRK